MSESESDMSPWRACCRSSILLKANFRSLFNVTDSASDNSNCFSISCLLFETSVCFVCMFDKSSFASRSCRLSFLLWSMAWVSLCRAESTSLLSLSTWSFNLVIWLWNLKNYSKFDAQLILCKQNEFSVWLSIQRIYQFTSSLCLVVCSSSNLDSISLIFISNLLCVWMLAVSPSNTSTLLLNSACLSWSN